MNEENDHPNAITMKVERLQLSNIGGDALAAQFQKELDRIHECFVDAEDGEAYEGRRIKARVNVKISLEYDLQTGQVSVQANTSSTLPKRKTISRPVMLRANGFLMEQDDEQLFLYEGSPKRSNNQ